MTTPPIAVWLDSYRRDLKTALQTAAADGFRELQANTTGSELNPRDLSTSARRHLARHLRDLGVQWDALAVEFPGYGLADPQFTEQRLDHLHKTLELCSDLQIQRATAAIRGFTDEKSRPLAQEILGAVADLADRAGIQISIQAGADDPTTVAEQLRKLACPALSLTLDAAHLSAGPLPLGNAAAIGAVYLRDVRRRGGEIEETSFGQGEVDFPSLLAQLAEYELRGPLVVRRDATGAGVDALRQGREYIRSLLYRRTPR